MKKFSDIVFSRLSNVFRSLFIAIIVINGVLLFSLSKIFEKSSDIGFLRGQLTSFSLMIYDVIAGIHSKEFAKLSLSESINRTEPILKKYRDDVWSRDFERFIEKFKLFIENPTQRTANEIFLLAENLNRKLIEIDEESRKISSMGVIVVIVLNILFLGALGFFMINYTYKLSSEFSAPLLEIRNIISKIAIGSIDKAVKYEGNIEEVYDIFQSIETLREDLYQSKLRIQEILRKYREGK